MSIQALLLQQSALMSSMAGLPRLVQSQLLAACCGRQQPLRTCCCCGISASSSLTQPHTIHTSTAAAAAGAGAAGDTGSSSSSSSSSSTGRTPGRVSARQEAQYRKRLHAYKARLPKAQKYGTKLLQSDPGGFERMRLVVGYYDLPQNRHRRRPDSPSHVTINNMQTLLYTHDVDAYYKLSLLSYRSKLENMEINKGLAKARSFLGQLTALPDFLPAHLEELTTAALQKQQQQQQAQASSSSTGGSDDSSSTDSTQQ